MTDDQRNTLAPTHRDRAMRILAMLNNDFDAVIQVANKAHTARGDRDVVGVAGNRA
jgi:hypothetical protein